MLGLLGAGHGLRVGSFLCEVIKSVSDGVVLVSNNTGVLLLKVDSKLVVNEGDHHSVMEGDEVRRLVLGNLSEGFHEHESSIAGELVFSLFSDEPSLILGIPDLGVISTDSLELNLDHSLHGATDGVVHLVWRSFQNNFLLDEVLVFFRGNPGGPSSESRWILVVLLTDVVFVGRSENVEGLVRGAVRL